MPDFKELISKHANLSEEDQKKAGQPVKGTMDSEFKDFLKTLIKLLDKGEIIAADAQSMLKKDVYDKLPQEWKDKVDLTLINIAEQVRLIENFYRSKETPDSSPQLETMILLLWQMKQRIEETHDVFKF